ncbi:phosphoglucosamine mutase [Stackebrandtia nassauensis]|uniref:Phosphoglucosamine mutase n=1 Tax=Stackebrandtia nassauensis (strain DSM 44728 / CIP 108903 / NRRL B-16338 / NBRC 102104 / LLR-40K-21) TaxID=446470 RepID=D3Q926_STANL|nr:phosphoglucosamine mutase [Stackebrandtia nassauensis]ADD40635.1 phosphoglucosamine mutase [Stackebrandtia nassauensis DSM 44728]
MGRLFGTDGVRGLANADLTPELAMSIAQAAVGVLARPGTPATVVVGRDPRASGEMLEAAVCAGLTSVGADVVRVGVLPTPAVAYLIGATGAAFGIMLSASHNPMPDNGVKLFAAGGEKLSDDTENAVEAAMTGTPARPTGAGIGRVTDLTDGADRYIEHLLSSLPHRLDGVHIVVDCANGAASHVAPEVYRRAGATVTAICAEPDGHNINDGCGSTHLDVVRAAVAEHGADLGIAHDGDADRCLAVAADGSDVDGDQIMAILAVAMKEAGTLANNTLVATVMSNLGLHQAMRDNDIDLLTTAVGDRYVLEELGRGSHSLGGEQSGHIVLPAHATTGDGLLTALQLMARLAATGKPLAELATIMRHAPQVLINVPVTDKSIVNSPIVRQRVADHEAVLGDDGRILLRPSGTEPLVRVMVEAATAEQAQGVAEDIAAAVSA